jgi:gliding motility-associated lipoprotein GldD
MFDATLHLTYYPFSSWAQYDSMVADTRSFVNKHIQKAEDIIEDPLENYNPNLHGLVFHIEGQTASNLNFYATDSTRHFLRGALYFNQKTQPDSIAPAFEFLWKDVQHALKTFKWK